MAHRDALSVTNSAVCLARLCSTEADRVDGMARQVQRGEPLSPVQQVELLSGLATYYRQQEGHVLITAALMPRAAWWRRLFAWLATA